MEPRHPDARSALLLGLTFVAWGNNYLFVRVGLVSASPIWLAALRAGVGVLALGLILLFVPPRVRLTGADRRFALLLGVPNTAAFLGLWFLAAASVSPGQSAVIIYTFPLWVALLSVPILRQRLGAGHWISMAIGFAGVLLVSQPWVGGAARPPLLALVELLGAAICWAFATVVVQRRYRPEAMASVNGYQLLGGALVLLALAVAVDPKHLPVPSPSLWVSVAWLGVFGTAFAYAVWFDLLGRIPAATLSGYSFFVPLVALSVSAVFLGERLDPAQGVGFVLILGSIYGISRAKIRGVPGVPTRPSRGPDEPSASAGSEPRPGPR
ncbi:MAG TPA: DMT family transporter [Thermoplasmata archaeon]|nr:DMT family transporter [Thermoplasmata archaeon]